MLEVKKLHAKIGDKEILRGINLTINDGEIHAIANVQTELDFEVKDGDTPLEVNELVVDEDWGSTRVYDSAHLNRLIDVSGTSAEECRRKLIVLAQALRGLGLDIIDDEIIERLCNLTASYYNRK